MSGGEQRARRAGWTLAIGVCALVALHVALSLRSAGPVVQADEGGYLGNATYLVTGSGASGKGYFAGYSLVLVPAELSTSSPLGFYRAALVTNAALVAATVLLVFALLRVALRDDDPLVHAVIALVVSLFPAVFLFAQLAMSENLMVPLVVASAVAVALGSSDPASRWWPVAGALAGLAVVVNPRGLVVLVALAPVLYVAGVGRRRAVSTLALGAVLAVAGWALTRLLPSQGRTPGDGRRGLLDGPLDPGHWASVVTNVAGRALYVLLATAGVVVVGLAAGWAAARHRSRPTPLGLAALFLGISLVVTLLGNAVLAARTGPVLHVEKLVYGRYGENLLPGLLALSLGIVASPVLARAGPRWTRPGRLLVTTALAALVLGAVVVLTVRPVADDATLNVANVVVLQPLRPWLGRWSPVGLTLVTAGSVVVAAALSRVPLALVVVLGLVFALVAWDGYSDWLEPSREGRARQRELVVAVEALSAEGVDTTCIAYDVAEASGWHRANYQLFLPASELRDFDSRVESPPCGPLVISGRRHLERDVPGARVEAEERDVQQRLWVVGAP